MKNFYKTFSLAILLMAFTAFSGFSQNAWINEIHYDNVGTDVNEFIEVVVENPGSYTLSLFEVYLYNGNNGATYTPLYNLSEFTVGATVGNFTFYYKIYPVNGIQNGSPDGMALVYNGSVIPGQYLSYEGAFLATNGPANGMMSVDIGVEEDNPVPPIGMSLQLSGSGTQYASFSWQPPAAETPGQPNNDQVLGGAPLPEPSNYPTNFFAAADNITITLTWTDATGAQLPSKYLVKVSDQDNITAPVDGVPVPDDTDLSDGQGALNVNFGVQTCMFFRLEGETQYYFKIYPYTNAGTSIDYKTDGTPPSTTATTEPVLNSEDFESNTFGTWSTYSVASDKDWTVVNFGGAYQTTYFAQMNGYQENEPSNDWLISPSLNMDVYMNEKMVFFTQWRFGNTDEELTLKYSTNYTGGDPTTATWSNLSFTKSTVQDIWTHSGNVDLSGITGSNVHIAFQYLSSGNPRRWGVDEIVITGYAAGPFIGVTSPVAGDAWEQGTAHDITWNASNTQDNVKIELTLNASSPTPSWSTLVASVPASPGVWTWLIPTSQQISSDCQIRITDIAADAAGYSGIFSIIEPIYIPQLVITEIMYNPPESGTDSLEFVELYNYDNVSIDLTGYYFSDGITYTFPSIVLNPGEYFLIAVDSVKFQNFYGMPAYQFGGALSNNGELLLLRNSYGMVVDSVWYDDVDPWPTAPDGFGPSLTFCDPGLDNALGENWSVSIEFVGLNANGDTIWASPNAGCASWPVADFIADNTVVLTGGSVNFTDLSTGDPDYWVWTFLGGTPGSHVGQTPPPIVYNEPGFYNVALFISNVAGTSTREKTDYIQVGSPPVANFSGNPTTLYAGGTVDFTDLSAGTVDSWLWEFPGGQPATSTEQNPQDILYATAGVYDVTLKVTNIFGTDEMLKEDYIDVLPVGIGEPGNGLVSLYPNPNNGVFRITNPGSLRLEIRVYNVLGALTESLTITGASADFDLTEHGKGIYFLQIRDIDSGQAAQRKVVIE
ncbi:MAG: lamin tail domain-containing protein [Bacteroidales bacterium]|nr:lamin tail domain-containing protein [Bacteroidales bacterium]